jgi:hypothetical protein
MTACACVCHRVGLSVRDVAHLPSRCFCRCRCTRDVATHRLLVADDCPLHATSGGTS